MKAKRVFIVGHMGAGKSLLGKTVADKLGWTHIDTNIGLERYIGRSLNEIIGAQGAEAFFQCQNEILTHYIAKENLVITTEDSFILSEKNRKLLSAEYVIYLKVTTPVQIERMSGGHSTLLPVDLGSFLDTLHAQRDALYEEVATTTIESHSLDADLNKAIQDISN